MEQPTDPAEPDNTAVRTALWRALHVEEDAQPYVFYDTVGLKLVAPPDDWQQRPDMKYTKRLRAAIVARARFIEDLIIEQSKQGIRQYIILGAGLDTFVQRRPDVASGLQVYEIDQPATLIWKQQRLNELGLGVPSYLHFVSVNFETTSWWEQLLHAGFDVHAPAVVACTGVSLYLTKEAIMDTLKHIKKFAAGSILAMTFYLPIELLDKEDKAMQEMGEKGARAAGTPFVSFFKPEEVIALANDAGFKDANIVSPQKIEQIYFTGRSDGLLPADGEMFLMART